MSEMIARAAQALLEADNILVLSHRRPCLLYTSDAADE